MLKKGLLTATNPTHTATSLVMTDQPSTPKVQFIILTDYQHRMWGMMETFRFPTFPTYANPVHFALFNNVANSSELRRKLIGASQMTGDEGDQARREVDYGFIDGSLVRSS